jgi:hypothetical protein
VFHAASVHTFAEKTKGRPRERGRPMLGTTKF